VNPAVAQKAITHGVVKRSDGNYDVAGEHGDYVVMPHKAVIGGFYCTCQAREKCSHILAVKFAIAKQEKGST
jgi:predicted nucleic acid-binding Zn finger protein